MWFLRAQDGAKYLGTLTLIRTLTKPLDTISNPNPNPNPPCQARPDADLSKEGAALIEVVTKLIANHAGG